MIEVRVLKQFEMVVGFSQIQWHGSDDKHNMVVMDMLGPSLEDLFEICGRRFSLKTVVMLVDQMVERVEQLHSRNYMHRNIRPQAFRMGINRRSHLVHLVDFALSKKYRDNKTQEHIPYK
jgi:serine/threonine protein kinase